MTILHSDDYGKAQALERDGVLVCPLCLMPLAPDSLLDWHCDNPKCSGHLDHYRTTR